MSNKIQISERKLPTIQELYDKPDLAIKFDDLAVFLNQPPPAKWVKTHPYVSGHLYLPIDKVEFMLQRFFKQYRIEITGQGTAFNGVWVTVRVHYFHPISETWEYHDGIGAMQLQTKKGTSPADLSNINQGALSMAFPIAKTLAVKDATDHFGAVFGAHLNRKDVMPYAPDEKLHDVKAKQERDRLIALIQNSENENELTDLSQYVPEDDEELNEIFTNKQKSFENESDSETV